MKETLSKPALNLDRPLPDAPPDRPPQGPVFPPIERKPVAFEVRALQALLDGEFAETRTMVKNLVSQFSYDDGLDVPAYRAKVLAWTVSLAEAGLGRIFIPRELGGEENLPKFIAAFEALAFHDLSLVIKVGVQFGLFAGSIQRLGTEYHRRKYLVDAVTARLPGCFAMTEIGHGSNVQGLETTAVYDRATDAFIINSPSYSSGKTYIGNAGEHGRLATVFAQLEVNGERHGVHAFLVPIRDEAGHPLPGITTADNGLKMGLNGVDNGQLWFDHVRVPRLEMLNRFAEVTPEGVYRSEIKSASARFFTMIGTLVTGRISIAATANSAAKSALTIAIRYAARRRQFGPPKAGRETLLLDYPAHQTRLMPLLANAYALDFALKRLVRLNEKATPGNSRDVETLAAALKAFVTWNTTKTIQTCRESCGGEGYMAVNRFAALKADTDVYATFEGDNTVLMQLVAKNLLTEFGDKLKHLRPAQLAGFFVRRKFAQVVKQSPHLCLNVAKEHLLDPAVQQMYFKYREDALLSKIAQLFRRVLSSEQAADPNPERRTPNPERRTPNAELRTPNSASYTAFTRLQPELLELAHAYSERIILEYFTEAIAGVENRPLQAVLKRMADLFALTHLDEHRAWYLEQGVFTTAKSGAIRAVALRLCRDLSQEAVALVDAFGIPDACLAAPIAL
ncbi:MAG: acyl-CoA dehydrogenase family protein [Verrucomicrobia bacterium]|nr:acyl-CoA dehydrogenase family protein [Verrucomicrobiota bacterium]